MRRLRIVLVVAALAISYIWLINYFVAPYAGGTDSSGYLNFARLLTHGEIRAPVRALPGHSVTEFGLNAYAPNAFLIRDDSGFMSPVYPIGAPLHFALAMLLVGSAYAVSLVNALAAIAAGMLTYLSCRDLNIDRIWAAGAGLTLCACPLVLYQAIQPQSDVIAMAWATATLYAAMRSRDRAGWAIACGVAVSMAVLVRPTNALLALPILIAMGRSPVRLVLAGLAALPAAIFLLFLNWKLCGSPFTTGYGSLGTPGWAGAWDLFSPHVVPHNLIHVAAWIFLLLGPLVTCGLWLPFCRRPVDPAWLIQIVWIVIVIAFYSFFKPVGEVWWYLRYILPAFPAILIVATGGLASIWEALPKRSGRMASLARTPWISALAISALVLLSVGWEAVATYRLSFLDLRIVAKHYQDVSLWARDHLPKNAVIVAVDFSGPLYYYTDMPIVRELRPDKVTSFFDAARNQNRPIFAVLWPHELEGNTFGGNWAKLVQIAMQKITVLAREPISEADKLKILDVVIRPDTVLDFRINGNAAAYQTGGWATPEQAGTWTDGTQASIAAATSDWSDGDMILEMTAHPFLVQDRHPSLHVDVVANGTVADRWSYEYNPELDIVVTSARIPASVVSSSPVLSIELQLDQPAVPKLLGVHPTDDRNLGLSVSRMSFRRATAPELGSGSAR